MSRRRKYQLPPPPLSTAIPSPAEIIELEPCSELTPGRPVTPLPGSPAPEIIVLFPRGSKSDPNRPLIPSQEEIEKLPRWARVAYLARCARRLLPLYHHFWPDAPRAHEQTLMGVVLLAEQFAITAQCDERARDARDLAYNAGGKPGDPIAAADTAFTISLAVIIAETADETSATNIVREMAERMIALLASAATVGTARAILAPRHDFDRISRLAQEQKWTDDTPVPPEVFGPMWDREPPSWWRENV